MSTDTEAPRKRTVRAVFVTYRKTVRSLTGQKREVSRTAFRNEELPDDVPAAEVKRLDALGALDDLDAATALARALNPADNVAEGGGPTTEPVTVSPPGMGAAPAGDHTKGDTGTEPVQPPPDVTPPGGGEGEAGEFDARGKSLDEAQAWLTAEPKPTAPQVVAAAHDDAEAAETLLEAERLTTGQDPRATVEKPLKKIIDADDGSA